MRNYLLISISILSLLSCKKNAGSKEASLLTGRWDLTTISVKEFNNSTYNESVDSFEEGAFFDFKPDGTFIMWSGSGSTKTSQWEMRGTSKVYIQPNDGFFLPNYEVIIKELTDHILIISSRKEEGTNYKEFTFYLHRL